MKKYLLLILVFATSHLCADEQTSAAQKVLKEQGFYFGEVTGDLDAQTTAAIKRFQIRNGLEVTGELDAQTTGTLFPPAPAAEPVTTPPTAPEAYAPPPPEAPPTPPLLPKTAQPDEGYAFVFAHTPYESAPPEVQQQTVRSAQTSLSQKGFYRGEIDGLASEPFQLALVHYQSSKGLPRTGQLDLQTLSALRLLPKTQSAPAERRVYRGIWVR